MLNKNLLSALTIVLGAGFVMTVEAADLRVRCETRANPARAKISIDANNLVPLNAIYSAQVASGTSTIASKAPVVAVGDEAEFDFDSNPADVAAGATAIPANFVVDGVVQASVFSSSGDLVVGPVTVDCRAR